MSHNARIDRRTVCAAIVGGGLGLAASSVHAAEGRRARRRQLPDFAAMKFYKDDGSFDQDQAKQGYLALLEYYRYPVNDNIRQNMFVSDFGLKQFAQVGLGGVLWMADKPGNYSSIEVFLLPDQMIPEHWHVGMEDEQIVPKMESWVVRYGTTFTYGEGEPTAAIAVKIHDCQAKYVTVRAEKALAPGEVTGTRRTMEKHWQQAGPEGCILTEVSSYHDGRAVRFTDPKITF